MNSVNIIGRIATDPLKNYIKQFDKYVVKFALAFDNRTRKTDGVKDTFFIECESWDKVAERIYDKCNKGDRVALSGHLEQAKFTRKDGSKASIIKLVVSGVEFLFEKHEKELPVEEEQEEVIEDDTLPF